MYFRSDGRGQDRQKGFGPRGKEKNSFNLHVDHKRVIYFRQDILLVADVHHLL